jgi:primosomal protein N''
MFGSHRRSIALRIDRFIFQTINQTISYCLSEFSARLQAFETYSQYSLSYVAFEVLCSLCLDFFMESIIVQRVSST